MFGTVIVGGSRGSRGWSWSVMMGVVMVGHDGGGHCRSW